MDTGHGAYHLFDANGEFERMVRGAGRWNTLLADPRGERVFTGDIRAFTGGASFSGSFTSRTFNSRMINVSRDVTLPDPPTTRPVLRLDFAEERGADGHGGRRVAASPAAKTSNFRGAPRCRGISAEL